MANIPLQSISFPGLSDKYTTPVVDNTLTQTGAAADAKKTGDEIGQIKNDLSDGTMTVNNAENAEQLTSTVGIEDNAPYLFRTSGGSNDIGDREDVKKIVGGTIANNQLLQNGNFSDGTERWSVFAGTATASDNILTYTASDVSSSWQNRITQGGNGIVNHVYIGSVDVKPSIALKSVSIWIFGNSDVSKQNLTANTWNEVHKIHKPSSIGSNLLACSMDFSTGAVGDTAQIRNFMVTDLTQDFGTAIADYVYSLETATVGAGVAWLKKYFPKQFDSGYQAYDAGSLQSVSGLTAHKMVGFNQWNEEAELGEYNISTGAKQTASGKICASNYISVLPDTTYYVKTPSAVTLLFYGANKEYLSYVGGKQNATFTTPTNAHFMTFGCSSAYGATYNHDICINLSWDGEKDGQYEPYKEYTYALDDSLTLRGIPKVDASGNLYYDGDEYLPDGTVNRRFGIVDLGTLTWHVNNHAELGTYFYADVTSLGIRYGRHQSIIDEVGICPKYTFSTRTVATFADKTICYDGNNTAITQVCIKDSAYSDGATFKANLSGIYLVYVKQTPTTETADPYQETQIVDDFGTEEFVLADGAFPVPVGHNTMYQNNLRAKLEMSPDSPDGDGLYVVQQESGENTYVPLASTATIQDILTRLTALENA